MKLKYTPVCAAAVIFCGSFAALAQQNNAEIVNTQQSAQMPVVVVSGARSERAIEDVPAVIDVIEGENLDPSRVQDIRDLVREMPNVTVKRAPQRFTGVNNSTGRDGNAGFNIRGLEGNRVLISVDGIRMPREMTSGTLGAAAFGRDYFDLGLVNRVEIVRGSNSALYGSDGLAGMVAMFTSEPKDLIRQGEKFGARSVVGYSSEDESIRIGVTLATQANEHAGWLLSANTSRSKALGNKGKNESLDSTRTAPNPQQDKQNGLLGKFVYSPNATQNHSFTLEFVKKDNEVDAYSGRSTNRGVQVVDLKGTTDISRTRLSWDGRFGIDHAMADEIRALIAFQKSDAQDVTTEQRVNNSGPMPVRVRDVSYKENLVQTVLQAEKQKPLSEKWGVKAVYGFDFSRTVMDNFVTGKEPPSYETYPLKRFPKTNEQQTALFVQSEFISEKWSLIPALRYDHYKVSPTDDALYPLDAVGLSSGRLSPKIGVIFRPVESTSIFGNVATGFKAPGADQLNGNFENAISGYKTIPNPNLKPETSTTFELGARGSRGLLNWQASIFEGRYKNFIEDLVRVGGSIRTRDLTFQSVNLQSVRISGFEAKGSVRLGSNTLLKAAYGQTKGRDSSTHLPVNSVNPAKWVAGVEHKSGDWVWGANINHVAKKAAKDIDLSSTRDQFATPSHTTLDLRTSWQVKKGLKLSAALNNVTDKKYWEWTNVRGISSGLQVLDAYTAPGRNLSVALTADF